MKKAVKFTALGLGCAALLLGAATLICLRPVGGSFSSITSDSHNITVSDRHGTPLSITYQTDWNSADTYPLYQIPPFLKDAFVFSEDRNFFNHGGVDWRARIHAVYQNIRAEKTVRGASTITEQVVRMINPRPRTLWSKWLEGIEAALLERNTSKAAILEFYLNQVPYAAHRRGVAQASRYYFNRSLETLSQKEMLALVILARAPSAYDLYHHPDRLESSLNRLAAQMNIEDDLSRQTLTTAPPSLPVDARHFARFVSLQGPYATTRTTLDAALQSQVQSVIDGRLQKLSSRNVANAGALVIDHETGQILAWVVGGASGGDTKGGEIDTVTTPRQPGSTLKPFLYAMALEKGWTAATILNDAPIAEAIGSGLHRFRNYSNTHYGPLTLREALGNSLNIPAILTIHHVGVDPFLRRLHDLGFDSLTRGAQIYDEGLALGNGEVTLLELTRAYAALARRGEYRAPTFSLHDNAPKESRVVYSPEISSIIGHILSDPHARALEFGRGSLLNMPVRTAAKTGTSTDYRDAWAMGYNDRYTVGIWMGNLDRTPMKEVTGSTGPALALRSIFQILNKNRETKDLYLSPQLVSRDVCARPANEDGICPMRSEWFIADQNIATPPEKTGAVKRIELVRPTNGLMIAYDPRIPASHQKFRFELAGLTNTQTALWTLNGQPLSGGENGTYLWPVRKGRFELAVTIRNMNGAPESLVPVKFTVK